MDRNSIYYHQVQLLMQVLPFVAAHNCFALKGGTAINLFVRDFPRLSVDIDPPCENITVNVCYKLRSQLISRCQQKRSICAAPPFGGAAAK